MTCDKFRLQIMEYLDGELGPEEHQEVERHLAGCSACRSELDSLQKLKEITSGMQFAQPEEEVWKMYWEQVYNRLERGLGWVLASVGAIILLAYGAFHFIRDFLLRSGEPLLLKLGVCAAVLGAVILFISVLRERLFIRKTDKYKEVEK
ncbi:MAG: zf-HC2 domain-containing protein [Candidatus Glassbacteria bacterium]|nr:zf-HC2 domain-containing protein [Candidatus Glassbacteria bacterium]